MERLNRRTAWDLCLLYGREARWPDEDPPTPHFWMQQLRIDGIPDFDEELLLVELDRHRA